MKNKISYPLTKENLSNSDILQATNVLRSKNITMGKITLEIESFFKNKIVKSDSLMLNSGSSANLLIFQCLINPMCKKLKQGDEVLIPAICWSTSLWPIVQSGLKPCFVDIDKTSLNICIEDLQKKITKKTKALMLVHALGNCADMKKIQNICKEKNIILIEDTCEALGSKYKGKYLGTFGQFSSFSMYYSHHITSGEGGFVTTKNKKYLNILKTLRSHGWAKEVSSHKKDNWQFINSGFNLRPTDINAAIGLNQLKRLKKILNTRSQNYNLIVKSLLSDRRYNSQFAITTSLKHNSIAWFGIPFVLSSKFSNKKNYIVNFLNKTGIETRPIISGNFANQPAVKLYKIKAKNLKNANYIEKNTFFLGVHSKKLKIHELVFLKDGIFNSFKQ